MSTSKTILERAKEYVEEWDEYFPNDRKNPIMYEACKAFIEQNKMMDETSCEVHHTGLCYIDRFKFKEIRKIADRPYA